MGLASTRCHHRIRLRPIVLSRCEITPCNQWVVGKRFNMGSLTFVLSGREGDQSSSPSTSIECHRSLVLQMGSMYHMTVHRDTLLSLMMVLSQATLTGSGRVLSGQSLQRSNEEFCCEVVLSNDWPADETAMQLLITCE